MGSGVEQYRPIYLFFYAATYIVLSEVMDPQKSPTVDIVALAEPRLELSNRRPYVALRGGNQVTYYTYPATASSDTNWAFNVIPPNRNAILDRALQVRVTATITFTPPTTVNAGGAGGGVLQTDNQATLQNNFDSLSAFPISAITRNLSAKINGQNVSVDMGEISRVWQRYHQPEEFKKRYGSLAPAMSDKYSKIDTAEESSSLENTMGSYVNGGSWSRGAYPLRIVRNDQDDAEIEVDIYENIYMSPFLFDGSEAGGLTGIDTLTFNFNLDSGAMAARIWSHSDVSPRKWAQSTDGSALDIKVAFGKPDINAVWITPKFVDDIPRSISYPHSEISVFKIGPNPLDAAGDDFRTVGRPIDSQTINLQSIPQKMYIYARQADTVVGITPLLASTTANVFAPIRSLKINYGNQSGLFSGCTPSQLYQMSVTNGLNVSWPEFYGVTQEYGAYNAAAPFGRYVPLCGAPICIEFGKDIGLKEDEAPGCKSQSNLSVSASFLNTWSATQPISVDMFIVVVYEGTMTIHDGRCDIEMSPLSAVDVLEAPLRHDIAYSDLRRAYGGSFLSTLRDISRGVLGAITRFGPPVMSIASALGSMVGDGGAQAGARAGSLYDSGASFMEQSHGYGGAMADGLPCVAVRPGTAYVGRGAAGGKLMSRTKMKKTLKGKKK